MEQTVVKLLCSGNPNHRTIASAVQKIWPRAHFASRATGYDLRFWNPGSEDHFRQRIRDYDVFVNASFICDHGQLALLETTVQEWRAHNIKGHVVNIGSAAEFLGMDSAWGAYSIQKRALRDRSLQLHSQHGIRTTHVILGGLNDGKPENQQGLDLDHAAGVIQWCVSQVFCVPLVYAESDYDARY